MATKTLVGTYSAGYRISAAYSLVDITRTGLVGGSGVYGLHAVTVDNAGMVQAANAAAGDAGADGVYLLAGVRLTQFGVVIGGQGGAGLRKGLVPANTGGAGVLMKVSGQVVNNGSITGGAGGLAVDNTTVPGGGGGVGVGLVQGGAVSNSNGITGGVGGAGGDGGVMGVGGAGGAGGMAVTLGARGVIVNRGRIIGGAGGKAGSGGGGGAGGAGGDGLALAAGGLVANTGRIAGGAGGAGGFSQKGPGAGGAAGAGLIAAAGVNVRNTGLIWGGLGGAGGVTGYNQRGLGGDGGAAFVAQAGASLTNSGHLYGGAGGSGGGGGGDGVRVTGAGRIVNSSTILGGEGGNAGRYAVVGGAGGAGVDAVGAAPVVNIGVITGGYGGSGAFPAFSQYDVGPGGLGGDGVDLAGIGGLDNAGAVRGGYGGYGGAAGGEGVVSAGSGSVANSGVILGGYGGYAGVKDGGAGGVGVVLLGASSLINTGTVGGGGGTPGDSGGDGSERINAPGAGGAGGAGVDVGGAVSVVNRGIIYGGAGGTGGYYYFNQDSIGGPGGVGGAGMRLTAAATLTNFGAIVGGAGGAGGAGYVFGPPGLAGDGVYLAGGGVVDNLDGGLISGLYGVFVDGGVAATVTNAGTIAGAAGAVRFAGARDLLIAQSGARFGGAILGGGGVFTMLGGGDTIAGLGGQGVVSGGVVGDFTGFGGYVLGAGRSSMIGVDALGYDQSLEIAGVLSVSGSLSQAPKSVIAVDANAQAAFLGGSSRFAGAITGAGTVEFDGGSATFMGATLAAATMAVNLATVTLGGLLTLTGRLMVRSNAIWISSGGATLAGSGTLALSDAVANTIESSGSVTTLLNQDVTLTGAGVIGGGGQGGADLRLVNAAGGVIDGDGTQLLEVDTGANKITNYGLIEAAGSGGVRVDNAVLGAGRLEVAVGALTFAGPVAAGETTLIDSGAARFFGYYAGDVQFTGATGQLMLSQSARYSGTISGFSTSGGTSLDFRDLVGFNGVSYSGSVTGGVLSLTRNVNGQAPQTVNITLAGDYLNAAFSLSDDGYGGALVRASQGGEAQALAVRPGAVGGFAAAISALDPGPAAAAAIARTVEPTAVSMISPRA